MAGDEFYDDDVTSGIPDWDFLRDQLKDHSSCPKCGSRMPARLGRDEAGTYGCSDCLTYPKCSVCGRWTGLEGTFAHQEVDHRIERLLAATPDFGPTEEEREAEAEEEDRRFEQYRDDQIMAKHEGGHRG